MATKEMKVCDLCGKPVVGHTRTVTIDETEYSEVCDVCVGRLNTFVKKLGEPHVSSYAKQKAKKAAAEAATATPPTPETPAEPVKETAKPSVLRRR